jgi:hypothetical protein
MKMRYLMAGMAIAVGAVAAAFYLSHRGNFSSGPLSDRADAAAREEDAQRGGGLPSVKRSVAKAPGTAARASIKANLTPLQAYEAAKKIVSCTVAVAEPAPSGLSAEQAKVQQQEFLSTLDCSSINQDYSVFDLAKYAAESGDPQAQLDFPALAAFAFNEDEAALDQELLVEYKSLSRKFLEASAKGGNVEALQRLAESYEAGRFTPKDPKLSYAYTLAYAQKTGSKNAHEMAERMSRAMTAGEVAEAQRIANTL